MGRRVAVRRWAKRTEVDHICAYVLFVAGACLLSWITTSLHW
jgi:hypothetical protein